MKIEKKTKMPSTGKTNSKIKRTYKLKVAMKGNHGKNLDKLTESGMV